MPIWIIRPTSWLGYKRSASENSSEEIKIVRETTMNELATNLLEEQVTETMQELFDNLITMISASK